MSKLISWFNWWRAEITALLDDSIFRTEGRAGKWHRFAHFWLMVWRSFERNRCLIRASALAYVTLLSIIPMLAVVMSITSTFLKQEGEDRIDLFINQMVASLTPSAALGTNGFSWSGRFLTPPDYFGPFLEDMVTTNVPAAGLADPAETNAAVSTGLTQAPEVVRARKEAARQIHHFIQNTRSGALGVTGTVLLIFAAISLLSRIETTFNDIWGVTRGRSWFMRIVLYWGVISLAPLLLVLALGLATGSFLKSTRDLVSELPFIGSFLLGLGFQLLPILVLCLLFAAFYMLMPNTKVDWRAALVGGLVGALLFHLNNMASVLYVSRVVSNSKIYGSLALVPVFMIGLYFAWLIVLLGGQVAYAYQNRLTYLEEKQVENINQRGREFIALRLMTLIGQRYQAGALPPTVSETAVSLGVPTRLVRQIMRTLGAARLVVETAGAEPAYLPARPMETITCHDILLAIRATQGQELATRDEPTRIEVFGEYQRIQEAERQAAASVTMLALVNRAQAQLNQAQAAESSASYQIGSS
jgi:membrane protein